ncbi:MAG TPA: hypothetical protein DCZ01_13300 [Elusimicrobia bacterium]|nr:MAG: hypothetical protein A2X37_08625 [Elusimicrobia bacterium GWA2_66_18]OGR68843.1 MAG: hypothetical protein A2X40_03745 [Elusimicrobia bacterium GWC2_65_9]HAZ09459.1 hypothetical protein [Elusimicrobiota bacterium]
MRDDDVCRPRVVVVDDEVDFLRLVEHWLKPKFAVTCLTGGVDTCEEVTALEPDLVIMDIHMPERGGFPISRQLRNTSGFEDLPVIFLTGSKDEKDFIHYLDFGGGCRFLTKPITGKALRKAVSEELGLEMVG